MFEQKRSRILLVDDDPALRESLQIILKNDFEVIAVESGTIALDTLLTSSRSDRFDVVLLDVMMPGVDGIEILKQIRSLYPNLPVLMVSASTTVRTAINAMKIGAVDFLQKPFQIEDLVSSINLALDSASEILSELDNVANSKGTLRESVVNGDFGCLIGQHPLMLDIFSKIDQLAPKNTTVLITGESGTGKELVAREIHRRSDRKDKPFIAINCAAIPESLVESELFGHEKGSFTHAVERRLGHFELADGGTIFLDEIGELNLSVQVKLLRVLQEREFYRIGRSKPVNVDIRIISATNKSLETAVKDGTFRQDLFFRVNVVNLDLPPLRKRQEDTERLVKGFLDKLSGEYNRLGITYAPDFINCLSEYSWPGNVRELENVIESILALSTNEELQVSDIPLRIRNAKVETTSLKEQVLDGILPFEEAEKQFETEIITKALEKSNFIQTKAAELLGISRRILKYKMDKLGIIAPEGSEL